MKILYFALFLICIGLVTAALAGLARKLAYAADKRYLHCRMIPLLLVILLGTLNVYTFTPILKVADAVINAPALSGFFSLILPNRAYELLYMLLVVLLLNLAVTAFVLLVLLIAKLVFPKNYVDIGEFSGFGKLIRFPWLLTALFYDERDSSVQLNSRGFTAGYWVGGLKNVFAVLWALETVVAACSILWGDDTWNKTLLTLMKAWYMLPMAGFLLLQQLSLFLEGPAEAEAGTFASAEIREAQKGDMRPLFEMYNLVFGDSGALILSDAVSDIRQETEGLSSNDLGNRQILDCSQPDVLTVISNQLRQCGVAQSEQYQNALVELLNGKSINICDFCEGEFLVFLAAYLNFYMAQGKTALLLCRDRKRADELCTAMTREMQRLNSLYCVWDVRTLEGAEVNSRLSLLVCSVDDFLTHQISGKRRDFVSDLFCTILADGFELFARNSIRAEQLFTELRKLDGMRQYVMFTDVNNDALRTALEHSAKTEILPFHNDAMHPNTHLMVWREDSFYKLQQYIGIGNALSPYMGVALPLSLVATKYDLPQVYLMGEHDRGDKSYDDVLTMASKEALNYIGKNTNLKSVIRYRTEEALDAQELKMLIGYDTDCNFLNAMWRWMKYGGTNGTLLHIVSPSYLLQEYFAANYRKNALLLKNNEFDALISSQLGMKVSHMAVLLVSLCGDGLTEAELMEKSREYHWHYENVDELLSDCLNVVLTREEIHSIHECFHFEGEKRFIADESRFESQTRITLTDATIRRRLQERIGYVTFVSKDDQRTVLPILRGNVHNYYLREQITAFDGFLYQILSITDGNIFAQQVLPQDVPTYHQISDFLFDKYEIVDNCVDSGYLDANICTASVTRRIYGYWSANRGNCFAGNGNVQLNDLRENGSCLEDHFRHANILELNIRRDVFGDRAVEAAKLLAYMLRELSHTLFPTTWQNLYAAVSEGIGHDIIPRVLSLGKDSPLDDMVCSLIPAVINAPVRNRDFITVYVVELSRIEYGMVQMLYTKFNAVMLMIREYLNWYLESAETEDDSGVRGTYLHFGSDAIPGVFDPEALLRFCRKLLPETEEIRQPQAGTVKAKVRTCTFCERPTMFPVELSDGRCMCGHCKDHQLTRKDEIKTLFAETQNLMEEGYSISFPKNIHVRFQSADAIAKAAGSPPGGRVLGFYNMENHQLWLEARGPRIAMQSTLIHELTHAWQFHDREFHPLLQQALKKFGKPAHGHTRLLLLEGFAVFVEIETMRRLHEDGYADRLHEISMQREDEYGAGYRLLRDYILQQEQTGSFMTPFRAITHLMQDIIDGKVTIT